MARELSESVQNKLAEIKAKVEQSYQYFQHNYDRYHKFKRMVYDTALTSDDVSKLLMLNKPNVEFNILEAYINRRIGEFAKHEPTLQVRAADGLMNSQITDNLVKTMEVFECHVREIIDSQNNDGLQTSLYKDTMSGGFSVAEVYTDYISDMSFEQCIKVERVFDPTLCGFDPLAKQSHKGDGNYCFKIVPRTKQDFEAEYGTEITKGLSFTRDVSPGSFNWSYQNESNGKYNKVLLECWFYQKENKREKIAKLSNGSVIVKRHYEQLLDIWQNKLKRIEQPPIIIEERWSNVESIHLYKLVENKIIDHQVTNYKYLPLVFFDGNSSVIKQSNYSYSTLMTRPYVYAAEGVQRLKNFAGQCIASELETLVQHKFMVALESIPEDYIDAYTNPQQAQTLAYNAFYEKNPNMPLPPPQVIQRTDTPAIVAATFEGTDRTTQAILGSFDAQQGEVGDRLSGRAIDRGAMQSDAASMPYLENFIKGLNRVGEILMDLIPKYYLTPRSIPIKKANGIRDFKVINDPSAEDSIDIAYFDSNSLQIKIEAGVNSSIQKRFALEQMTRLAEALPIVGEFINNECLDVVMDNIDIRGSEILKERAVKFMEAKKNTPPPPDPLQQAVEMEREKNQSEAMIAHEKIQAQREDMEAKHALGVAELAIKEQEAHTDFMKVLSEIREKDRRLALDENAHDTALSNEAIELALDIATKTHDMEMRHKELMQNASEQQNTQG